MTNVLPLKRGVSRNTAMHALPTARNFVLVLLSTSPFHSPLLLFLLLLLLLFVVAAVVVLFSF